ncbi:hypothetical protein [Streptomyces sp. NPDC096934]|uniref:hypothetical protein n=1 Tax=Streptomyces sp. NPDC096934 TaxID=3155551 RepID=UPI00331D254C
MNKFWQVHWVTRRHAAAASDHPVPREWADLDVREEAARIDPGDVFFTDPNYQVGPRLTLYTTRSAFAHLARETRRNHAGDCCLFFNFLWQRGKNWCDAEVEDLLDFEDWRRWSPRNPRRIGGSKWDRELSALARLYKWAGAKRYVAANPVVMREVLGRHGEMVSVPAQRAKNARSSNVKWLTPRAYRLWRDVGLRGYTADGRRDPSFRGRNDDRNAAYSDLLFSSGMRLSEGGSLLTLEVPVLEESVKRFFDGRLAKAATKSRRERTFYVAVEDLRSVAAYERTTRRAVIRRAQAKGVYESRDDIWVLEKRSGGQQPVLHLWDENGQSVQRPLLTACFIVLGYLTGMRTGEILALENGCCPDPQGPPEAARRHLIYARQFKGARDEDGNHQSAGVVREAPWVAVPQVVAAVRVLEQLK